jgi:mono/diheme cytochrome c family protein
MKAACSMASEDEDPARLRHFQALAPLALCALLVALTACGHTEGAATPDAAPRSASAPTAARSLERAPRAMPEERIEDYMADHFVIVTFSRDAVINGDLEALREPLRALADYDYEAVAPGGWLPWIARIQAAARLTSDASTLEAAASGVVTMAQACGGCHEASAGGPDFDTSGAVLDSPASDTLDARMQRHIWAADRLWEGLIGPSAEAWRDGASALAHAPSTPPITNPPLPPRFAAALLAMRELAEGSATAKLDERAEVYAELLASCASCHARGVEFGL